MNDDLRCALLLCETDLGEVMNRFLQDEALYVQCLNAFLQDQTIAELRTAVELRLWDEAFTAAHALKGLAGNMGFVPLFHATAELVILIRAGRTRDVGAVLTEIERCHSQVVKAIRQNCVEQRGGHA